jgi:hypothetical protein
VIKMKSNKKIVIYELVVIAIIVAGTLMSGCITFEKQSGVGVLQGFEVHEWGVFQQKYNSNIVNILTQPLDISTRVDKPVVYFHYDKNISDVVVEVDINGDILVTIPDAINTGSGIGWTIDIVNNSVIAPDGTEYEYLFYECQMNISQCVVAYVLTDGKNVTFYVKNIGGYPLSDIFFIYGGYLQQKLGLANILGKYIIDINYGLTYIKIDELANNEEKSVIVPLKDSAEYNISEIKDISIELGLTEKEALELVDYWEDIWFHPTYFSSFVSMIYTIPQEVYDELLPISINPKPETMHRVGLFFLTDIPINDQPILSSFKSQENCSIDEFNESAFGVKEVSWLDDTTLYIKAIVDVNCARHIGNGSISIENETLKLGYEIIGEKGLLAECECAYELNYTISNIQKWKYEIELVPKLIEY